MEIHQSHINTFFQCGERYRRRYVEGHKIPPQVSAARGSAVHIASKENLTYKIIKGEDMPLGDVLDAARDGYAQTLQDGVYLPREEAGSKRRILNQGLKEALLCSRTYRENVSPLIVPTAIEEPFHLPLFGPLEGVSVAGTIDYEDQGKSIGDLKTSGRKWPEGRIKTEIQPRVYSWAYAKKKKRVPEFVYHILQTNGDHSVQKMNAGIEDFQILARQVSGFVHSYRAGVFLPAPPGAWWCSEKWCGYWRTCKYVGN